MLIVKDFGIAADKEVIVFLETGRLVLQFLHVSLRHEHPIFDTLYGLLYLSHTIFATINMKRVLVHVGLHLV